MSSRAPDTAQIRLDNALRLFDEFVRATARHADAATLRGLERRFAERVQIQPSYWSQLKGRTRQIGERLARQFEQLCHKPRGWMDHVHATPGAAASRDAAPQPVEPRDDDERFVVALVLSYYRLHPDRARSRLLGLLGEVLTPAKQRDNAGVAVSAPPPPRIASADEAHALWLRSQAGVAPLKRKK